MSRARTALLASMEAETSHLLAGAIARGARAMDAIASDVLAAVRRADSFDAARQILSAPDDLVGPSTLGSLLSALSAGMVTGDLLGRGQVTQEAKRGEVVISPIDHAFPGQIGPLGSRFAAPGSLEVAPLTPKAAIEYFRAKIPLTTTAFEEISDIYRGRAFTIAKQQTVEAVQVVQGWLERSLADGLTFRDFLGGLNEAAAAGGITAVNPYHAATVFQTNIQTAYNAGRWEMYHAPEMVESFPYFQNHTVGDDRVRPTHAQMEGFIARRDDAIWERAWPPYGFGCRCTVTAISAVEAERDGIRPSRRQIPHPWPDAGFAGNAAKAIRTAGL